MILHLTLLDHMTEKIAQIQLATQNFWKQLGYGMVVLEYIGKTMHIASIMSGLNTK